MVLVLTAISLIAGGTLAYINKVTQGPIAEINAKNLQDGIKKVILGSQPGDLKVEEPVEANGYTLYKTDKGTAVKAVTNGFGGPLEILVGFNEDGNILGYTILATVETPGLGVKADTWFQEGGKGTGRIQRRRRHRRHHGVYHYQPGFPECRECRLSGI